LQVASPPPMHPPAPKSQMCPGAQGGNKTGTRQAAWGIQTRGIRRVLPPWGGHRVRGGHVMLARRRAGPVVVGGGAGLRGGNSSCPDVFDYPPGNPGTMRLLTPVSGVLHEQSPPFFFGEGRGPCSSQHARLFSLLLIWATQPRPGAAAASKTRAHWG
jgi:hypothetical protein